MKNKIISTLLVSAMAVSMLAGCGSSDSGKKTDDAAATTDDKSSDDTAKDDGASTDDAAAGGDVELNTVSMFGGTDPQAVIYQEIIDELKAEYPNIKVLDNSQSSSEDWKATVAADFSVGNEPDVIQYFTDANASAVLATDKFVTVEEIQAEYPEYAADTTAEALELTKNPDGVSRAVPTTGYWEGLFCNKKLFDEYNLELPTDWDSLVTAVTTFKENGIIPIAVSLNSEPHYWLEYCLLYASGADTYTKVPDEVPAEWVKGLETFKTLRDLGAFPEDTDSVDNAYVTQLFVDGQAAMQLDGNWRAGSIEDTDNTVVVAFPGVEDQKAEANAIVSGISSGFYITKKAWDDPAKRDAAVKFVMAHTSKDGVQRYWESTGAIAVAATEVEAAEGMSPMALSALEYVNAATSISSPTDSRLGQQAYGVLISNVVKMSVGEVTPEDVLEEALAKYKETVE